MDARIKKKDTPLEIGLWFVVLLVFIYLCLRVISNY